MLEKRLAGAVAAIAALEQHKEAIRAVTGAVGSCLRAGGTLYTAGNGGSAAQAMHLAEELVGRYRGDRQPWPAVCLSGDPTALTCIANDFGYDEVFARQTRALVKRGDTLVVLSTSGRSANVVKALEAARERGATTIGLLGNDGGVCVGLCDHSVIVPVDDSAHVQEAHQVLIHLICEAME